MHLLLMAAPQQGGSGASNLIMIVMILVVFYFFMFYPQQKKAKAQKKFRENLSVGDKVITIGGVHGEIEKLEDATFVINSMGTRLRLDKTSISMEASQALNQPKKEEKK